MSTKLRRKSREDEQLARDLRRALREKALNVVYQPIVDGGGERILAVEALCRWRHPARGDVPPTTFIRVAEEAGLIAALGEWVLREACRDARDWPGVRVSVNASPQQIRRPDFVDRVRGILAEAGLEPARLELEFTENLLLGDIEDTRAKMRRLRDLGVRIALDDFGTGYSSLNYLATLPFDKLKIDRSFVLEIGSGVGGPAIIHAIASLGRALGLHVTAEGIETAEQHRFLRVAGVHSFQGYRFSQPVEAAAISKRIAAQAAPDPISSRGPLARAS